MKIWAFPSFYPFNHKGLRWKGIFAHRQYKGLIANGADLKVIVPVSWYPPKPVSLMNREWRRLSEIVYPDKTEYDGIEVIYPRIANMKPSRIFTKPYRQRYLQAIVKYFKSNNITLSPDDIFYAQWLPDAGVVQMAARELGVKSAILGIGDDILILPQQSEQKKAFFEQTWAGADYRIVVARYLAVEANKLCNANYPYHVVRRGVEHDNFTPVSTDTKMRLKKQYGLHVDKMYVLCVGAPILMKGWLDLFDAIGDIVKDNRNVVIIGVNAGHADLNLDDEAAKRGLSEHFLNMGEVDPKKMNELYAVADIFCLPSHSEGIANAVVEAMSCGIPVITTNICGHPELVTSGKNGILVEPRNIPMLTASLKDLIGSDILRKQLAENSREFIVKEWGSFGLNAGKLYKIFEGR